MKQKSIFLTITAVVIAVIVVIVIFIAVDASIVVIVNMIVAIIHVKMNIFDVLNGVNRSNGNGGNSTSPRGIIFVDRGAVGNVVASIYVINITIAVHFMIIAAIAAISAI